MSKKIKSKPELNYNAVELLLAKYIKLRYPNAPRKAIKKDVVNYMVTYKQSTLLVKSALLDDLNMQYNTLYIKKQSTK